MDIVVHNFIFLSTFSGKLYEHLNIFIRIGHVSWYLLNMFLGIFVIILLFFISTNQNHLKIKKNQTLLFQISTKINQTLRKMLNPTSFIPNQPNVQLLLFPSLHKIIQTLTNTIKPQIQTSNLKPFPNPNKTQIRSKINSFKHQTDTHTQTFKHQPSHGFMRRELSMNRTSIEEKPSGERDPWLHEDKAEEEQKINGGGERFRGEEERE